MTTTSSFISTVAMFGVRVVLSLRVGVLLIVASIGLALNGVRRWRSVDQREKRLPFFDDIRGEFHAFGAADRFRRVNRSRRDEQNVAGLEHHRRPSFDLVLE